VSSLQPPGFGGPTPPVSVIGSTASLSDYEEPRKASALPLVLGIILTIASGVLFVLDLQGIDPFTYNYFNIIGYVLTPFLVFMCLAWDTAAQRAGRRSPWFDIRPGYSKTLRVLAVVALAVAVPHILEMGRAVGEWVVQAGIA